MKNIPIKSIHPSPMNPRRRFNAETMKDLEQSIKLHGVLQPILVRHTKNVPAGEFEIIAGERRFRAAKAVGLDAIPAVELNVDDKHALEIMVIENLQRSDLHPLEEAEGYEQLMKEHGYKKAEEIAAKIGKSRSYVYGRMKLCDLNEKSRKSFYEGKLTPSTALLVARMPTSLQDKVTDKILNTWNKEPMSFRDAQSMIQREFMLDLKDAPFDTEDTTLCPAAGSCAACPKRTGNQKDLFGDVKGADVCTDPKCFAEKKEQDYQKRAALVRAKGYSVLPKEKSEKIFRWGGMNSQSGYVALNDKPQADKQGRTFSKLLKDKLKPADIQVAFDEKGREHRLVLEERADEILRDAGHKFIERRGSNALTPEQKEKLRLETKASEMAAAKAMQQLQVMVAGVEPVPFLRRFVLLAYRCFSSQSVGPLESLDHRGIKSEKDLEKKLASGFTSNDMKAVLIELQVGSPFDYGDFTDEMKAACQIFGVDLKAIVKEELKTVMETEKVSKAKADKIGKAPAKKVKPFNPVVKA